MVSIGRSAVISATSASAKLHPSKRIFIMKYDQRLNRMILVASFFLFPLILPGVSPAAETEGVMGGASSAGEERQALERIAVESVQDSLKACLARIPSDASAGQRMLAEQNCQQTDSQRQGTQKTF
jgi:hypothetical protein